MQKKITKKKDSEKTELVPYSEKISESKKRRAIKLSELFGKKYSEKNVKRIEGRKNSYSEKEGLSKIWDTVEYLWKKLKEKETPTNVKIAIFGGFAYLIFPADIIPDVIPGLGMVDDAAVFLYIYRTVGPYLKDLAKDIVDDVASSKIKVVLSDTYKKTIIKSVFVFLLNLAGTLLVCFEPFGKTASAHSTSVLFTGAFVFSMIQFILFIKNYGVLTYRISISILKKKSVRQGIADFVRTADENVFRILTKVFNLVDVVNKISDLDLPSMEDVIHHFVKKFLKNIFLFFGLYFLYVISVYWFLKPFLLQQFAGMNLWQIMVFPFWKLFYDFSVIKF